MIKRIRFATRDPAVTAERFDDAWPAAVAAAAQAPAQVRPLRLTVSTTLHDLTGPDARHDGVALEWFHDAEHLRRFEEWSVSDPFAGPVVVADELVLRGAGWLAQRWADGGERLKHMALARRAEGLTPAEFSARWRSHAGQAGRATIPDEARGSAYVQNHPHPEPPPAYDAVNEVYVDDVASLRARIAWFAANPGGSSDLVRESWFLVVRERVVPV